MIDTIKKYGIQALCAVVTAFFGWGYKQINNKLKQQEALKMGVQALLRNRIIEAYNYYIEKQFMPIYALEDVNAMYNEYHNLGGNGTVTTLVEELNALSHVKEKVNNGIQ